jgi:hypothetical protein
VADDGGKGAGIPFWVHQAIEYLLAAFAFTSLARIEPRSAGLCAGAGAFLLLLPAISGGRLGVTELVGPRLHRVLDYLAVPALATSPWWSGVGWGAGGVWVVEALAVGLLWLARATSYRRAVPDPPRETQRPPALTDATAANAARAAGRLAGTLGRKGPRAAGVAVGRIKKRRDRR